MDDAERLAWTGYIFNWKAWSIAAQIGEVYLKRHIGYLSYKQAFSYF